MNFKKTAIFSLSILIIMATDTVAPLVAKISTSFASVSPTLIKQTITLPALMMIIFSLLAGQLVKVLPKKVVLSIGLGLYTFGGIAAGWAQSFTWHLILRSILGAGTGLVAPLVSSFIADFFEGKERIDMIGYSMAVSHMGGVIMPPLAAWVGGQDWRIAFLIYAIAPVIFIFSMLFIPKQSILSRSEIQSKKQAPIPPQVIWLSVASLLMVIVFFIIITDIPFLIQSKSNIASYVTTFGLSISTFGSTISGLAFSWVYLRIKKWITPVGLLITAFGFILATLTESSIVMLFGLLLTGVGIGFLIALITLLATNSVGTNDSTAALALVNSAFSVGIFVSPFFFAVFPSFLTPQPTVQYNFQLAGYLFLGAGILATPLLHFLPKISGQIST
jgi:predicted MFS family arabinose efflux permease